MMKDFMSFKERLVSDPAFLEKYRNQKDTAAMIAMAKEDGYEFTEEDLLQNTEITDFELRNFVGGLDYPHDGHGMVGIVGDYGEYSGIIG